MEQSRSESRQEKIRLRDKTSTKNVNRVLIAGGLWLLGSTAFNGTQKLLTPHLEGAIQESEDLTNQLKNDAAQTAKLNEILQEAANDTEAQIVESISADAPTATTTPHIPETSAPLRSTTTQSSTTIPEATTLPVEPIQSQEPIIVSPTDVITETNDDYVVGEGIDNGMGALNVSCSIGLGDVEGAKEAYNNGAVSVNDELSVFGQVLHNGDVITIHTINC